MRSGERALGRRGVGNISAKRTDPVADSGSENRTAALGDGAGSLLHVHSRMDTRAGTGHRSRGVTRLEGGSDSTSIVWTTTPHPFASPPGPPREARSGAPAK